MSKWIKKDDQVVMITGNDKGKIGTILSRHGDRVVVKGVNLRKKHVKSKSRDQASRIVELEMSVHVSNVALCNDKGDKLRVKMRRAEDGGKELYCIEGDKETIYRKLKKPSTH